MAAPSNWDPPQEEAYLMQFATTTGTIDALRDLNVAIDALRDATDAQVVDHEIVDDARDTVTFDDHELGLDEDDEDDDDLWPR